MRVGTYARVSGAAQEDNTSLANQRDRCDAHSARNGYEVVAREVDIVSGEFILARSAFNRLLALAAEGQIDRIIVDIPDRLGRGDAIAVLRHEAEKRGARIEYATAQPDEKTLPGIVSRHASALVGAVERHNINRRMSGGRVAKAKSGRIIAGPRPKFGYKYHYELGERGNVISCDLVIDEAKIQIYHLIVGWILDGIPAEGIGPMSIRQACKRLTAMSIPSPSGRSQWSYQGLYKILTSPVYTGRWEYGRNIWELQDTSGGAKSRVIGRRSDADTIVVAVPAAIDEDRWQQIQARLKANKTDKFLPKALGEYLARSICKCSRCGYTLIAERRRSGNGAYLAYYSCHHRRHNWVDVCKAGSVRANAIDETLWHGLCVLLLDDDVLRAGQEAEAQRARAADAYTQQIKANEQTIVDCRAELKRLARERIGKTGRTSKQVYDEMELDINRRADAAQAMIDNLVAMRDESRRIAQHGKVVADIRRALSERMTPETPFAIRRAIVERLQARCTWDHAERILTVSCVVGSVALSL